jgi:CubicO group peptidase (beta-lactamase class C family)
MGGLPARLKAATAALERRAKQGGHLFEFGDPVLQLDELRASQLLPRSATVEEPRDLIPGDPPTLTEPDRTYPVDHRRVVATLPTTPTRRRDQLDPADGRYGWAGGTGATGHVAPSAGTIGILLTQVQMPGPMPLFRRFWQYAFGAAPIAGSGT